MELKRFQDDGGNLTELGRLNDGIHAQLPGFTVRQVNYSELEPGAIKAFHLHKRQTDVWYVPPADKLLLVLHDCRAGSPTENTTMRFVLGDGASRLVRIPRGGPRLPQPRRLAREDPLLRRCAILHGARLR